MEAQEQMYSVGFNHGYLLEKYMPDLVAKMTKTVVVSDGYTEGFIDGKEEYEIERSENELNDLRNRATDRDMERGR